ncbi:MAG: chloride channel protein [Chloroflexota bacterium]|nr:MAG: chloride channel protein [Chloroflexota bacterium]
MFNAFLETLKSSIRAFQIDKEQLYLIGESISIGLIVWVAIFLLKELVHWSFQGVLRWIDSMVSPFFLFVPLLSGAMILAVISKYWSDTVKYTTSDGEQRTINDTEGDGIERAILFFYASDPEEIKRFDLSPRWKMPTIGLAIRKFIGTVATLGSGGSGGLEASSALIGENLAAWFYKLRSKFLTDFNEEALDSWHRPNVDHLQIAQLGGVAAAITVLMGTPLAAAFFATEVMYRDRDLYQKLFYTLISALIARLVSAFVAGTRPLMFTFESIQDPPKSFVYILILMVMIVGITLVGQIYRFLNVKVNIWFQKIANPYIRLGTGAALTGMIAMLTYYFGHEFFSTERGVELVLGSGETVIQLALDNEPVMGLALIGLLAKMAASLITIGSGGSAGLLVPALFFGTMVAAAFGEVFSVETITLLPAAMTASLIALVNTPLAAILFAIEIFGAKYMVPILLALVITWLLSNPRTIYRTQEIAPRPVQVE